MISEETSDKIKNLWTKYSNLYPADKVNLIDKIFDEIYDILNGKNENSGETKDE
jgi:hypothetical protein